MSYLGKGGTWELALRDQVRRRLADFGFREGDRETFRNAPPQRVPELVNAVVAICVEVLREDHRRREG
ncbi:MAG: hypothetical protein GX591_11960 [Planctomycetes bacterium]|nr:hypothetical protein [Planctomycetota bacterium]